MMTGVQGLVRGHFTPGVGGEEQNVVVPRPRIEGFFGQQRPGKRDPSGLVAVLDDDFVDQGLE